MKEGLHEDDKIRRNTKIWKWIYIFILLGFVVAWIFNLIESGGLTFVFLFMLIVISREECLSRIRILEVQ